MSVEIFKRKAHLVKMLKGKSESEHCQRVSFRYFLKQALITKLLPKISSTQTTISRGTFKHELVKRRGSIQQFRLDDAIHSKINLHSKRCI